MLRYALLFSTLFCCYLGTSLVHAQQLPQIQEDLYYGGGWQDEGISVFQNLTGRYVLVGNTQHFFKQKKDIFFTEIDSSLRIGIERKDLGGQKGDVVYAAIQAYDGSYILAGYTEKATQKHLGKKDAWILKVREDGRGDPLLDLNLGSAGDDVFHDVVQDQDGNIILGGQQGDKLWVVKLDAWGKEIWSNVYPTRGAAVATSLLVTPQGDIVLTGWDEPYKEEYQLLVIKIGTGGNEIWREAIVNAKGKDIIINKNGDYSITGVALDGREEDILLAKVAINGKFQWAKTYGKRGRDGGEALLQQENGNYYLTGHSMSYQKGAKRSKIWLSEISPEGELLRDTCYGGRLKDIGNHLLLTNENSLLLTGTSASGKKTEFMDAWLLQFQPTPFATSSNAPVLEISNPQLIEPNKNGKLDPTEWAYVAFDLTNKSLIPAYQLTGQVNVDRSVRGMETYQQLHFGHLKAGATRRLSIPVRADTDLATGLAEISLQLNSTNGGQTNLATFPINCLREPLPKLILTDTLFVTANGANELSLGSPARLKLKLKNTGEETARRVRVKFSYPYKVTALSEKMITIDSLVAGAEQTLEFEFQAQETYLDNQIRIACRVSETTARFGIEEEYFLGVKEVIPAPPIVTTDEPDFKTQITWIQPQANTVSSRYLPWDKPEYLLKVLIYSTQPVDKKEVKIYLNGDPYNVGVKLDVVQLNRNCKRNAQGIYECFFEATLTFPEGKQEIIVHLEKAGEAPIKTKPFRLIYKPKPVSLHLLAIGIHYPNQSLEYTDEDARDIAAQYQQLEGKQFTKVYTQLLTTEQETQKQAMEDALNELKNRFEYESEGIDRSEDVVVVFVSGHGFIEDRDLYLEGSDNEGVNRNSRSLRLRMNILETLKSISCRQKIVLVDACRKNIRNSEKSYEFMLGGDIPVLFSTSAGKVSYEHETWQNGAFSEAILQAYANPQVVDKNANNAISVWELYEYIYRSMPKLVSSVPKLKDKQAEQVPYLDEVFLDRKVAVFNY